jgi:heptaprenyl diphosphate synthase
VVSGKRLTYTTRMDLASLIEHSGLFVQLEQLDNKIEQALKPTPESVLGASVSELVNSKRKRLRPFIVFAAAELGRPSPATIDAATVIELIHLASLIHDDVLDMSDSRWNKPTAAAKLGPEGAIVLGDYVLSQAFAVASQNPKLARLATTAITALCEGQSLELADRFNQERTIESYTTASLGKTATLFSVAATMGGESARLEAAKLSQLDDFGRKFGLAFQILNDIEDLQGPGSDLRNGNYTLPLLLALSDRHESHFRHLLTEKRYPDIIGELSSSHYFEQALSRAAGHLRIAETIFPESLLQRLSRTFRDYIEALTIHISR